jgi:hypothetical protein
MKPEDLWWFLVWGYCLTVLIEAPILWVGLSPRHSWATRLIAGFWLTACTYPIVILVLPLAIENYWVYLAVAETFAPLAECLLFWVAFGRANGPAGEEQGAEKKPAEEEPTASDTLRDMAAIVVANLASFGLGLLMDHWRVLLR